MRCIWGGAASIRDLLVIVTTFSLLSLFLTYHLGFPASRLRLGAGDEMGDVPDPSVASSISAFPADQLRLILRKLEKEQIERLQEDWRMAKVQGQLSSVRRDLPLYTRALRKAGFFVLSKLSLMQKNSSAAKSIERRGSDDWSLLLCLVPLEGDDNYCFNPMDSSLLKPSQKVSQIPILRSSLWHRSGLCRTRSRLSYALSPPSHAPSCFSLPDNFEEFLTAADGPRFNKSWVLKSASGNLEHLTTMEFFSRVRRKEFSSNFDGVVEEYIPNQLRIFGYPVSVQYYVLVTSMEPLRVYVYNEGLVHFRQEKEKGYRKIPGKTWLLSQLWRHLAKASPTRSSAVRLALERADEAIAQLLLAADASLAERTTNSLQGVQSMGNAFQNRCCNCFQLLTVELVYNSSLHPEVMEVDGLPSMQEAPGEWIPAGGVPWGGGSGNRAIAVLRHVVLVEMLKIVFASDAVHEDVLEALQSTAEELNIGIAELNCVASHAVCLTTEDLSAILETRREAIHLNDFRRLYPTPNGDHYSKLIETLHSISINDILRDEGRRVTLDMHTLLSRLEAIFGAQEVPEYEYSYLTETKLNHASFNLQSVKISGSPNPSGDGHGGMQQKHSCSSDESAAAYLRELELEPSEIRLDPPFTPFWTEYSAVVPYLMTMIRLTASPMRCSLLVRFEDRLGPTMSINTTLGVGLNRIPVYLVDSIGTVVTTYMLLIRRKGASEGAAPFNPFQKHSVCSLRQECDFRISPTEPCGLEEEQKGVSWNATLQRINELPPCHRGDASGRWIVPCTSCSLRDSCVWRIARWQPYSCTHRHVTKEELDRCLDGKKLLFLGDSTNRGMMHYIMERLNGSLAACDKTHYIRVYGNLNRGRTAFSFAYYPQFWLPPSERPVFDKALYQLLLKSQPLQNTSNTVVIVGGVHWLATQHLHALIRAMRREGLQGSSLVVKTLGSGFHTPAEGVHYLSKAQQEKLLLHSMGLAAFAHHHHMEVVDTFNITAARYKDFLQGKCACHFHKIVERPGTPEEGWPKHPRYQVEGPINAIYTEILLSRLCKGNTKEET